MKRASKEQITEAARAVVDAFAAGDVPKALATKWIHRDPAPCDKYSLRNRMLIWLRGHEDARTFCQWKEEGRYVTKGESGFDLFRPMCVKDKDNPDPETGDPKVKLVGFWSFRVFGKGQTSGQETCLEAQTRAYADELPLRNVATAWNVQVDAYGSTQGHGSYSDTHKTIRLHDQQLATWLHELMHAADFRAGTKTEAPQHWRSEAVAQLGAATLAQMLGHEEASDLGFSYEYISHYAKEAGKEPVNVCLSVLDRVAACIDLIMTTAQTVATAAAA